MKINLFSKSKKAKKQPQKKGKRGDILKDVRFSPSCIEPHKLGKKEIDLFKMQLDHFIATSPKVKEAEKKRKDKKTRGEPLKYKMEFGYKIIELMAEGKDKLTAVTEIGVAFSNFNSWRKYYPEFDFACRIGEQLQKRYWADLGRLNIANRNFSYVGWMMNMTNRFRWVNSRSKNQNIVKKTYKKQIDVKIEDKRIARIVNMAKRNGSIVESGEVTEEEQPVHTN